MDSFEFNKIAMAVLGVVFAVFGLSLISEGLYHSDVPAQPGYAIAAAEAEAEAGGETAAAAVPIATLLASADPAAGEAAFKKCATCHSIEKGGPNKVGPGLWGVMGRPIASHEGFAYSAAMSAYGQGKSWTFEEMNGFILAPKKHIPGTAMGFAGIKKDDERGSLLAWMNTQSDSPQPLPEPVAAEASTGEQNEKVGPDGTAPAEGTAPGEATPAPAGTVVAPDAPAPVMEGGQPAPSNSQQAAPQLPAPQTGSEPAPMQSESPPTAAPAAPAPEGQTAPAPQGTDGTAAPASGATTAPATPTEPAAPAAPTAPATPVEPTAPAAPTAPAEPTAPATPTAPAEPTAPAPQGTTAPAPAAPTAPTEVTPPATDGGTVPAGPSGRTAPAPEGTQQGTQPAPQPLQPAQ